MRVYVNEQGPLVRLDLRRRDAWRVNRVRNLPLHRLPAAARQDYAAALERYLTHRWREPRARARYRYDLALLQDPGDPMPPSNRRALERFGRAGRRLGLDTELIGPRDLGRLAEYDALFIRATTQVNHFTYRFATRAAAEGLAVIDDPESIVRCSNKVYQAELFDRHGIPCPKTLVVHEGNATEVADIVGLPCVLKKPDGSFSSGVVKVSTDEELSEALRHLFQESELVVAQEFAPSSFDWRVGVLDRHVLYVCRYYMAKGHWQIVQSDGNGERRYGKVESVAVEDAPPAVVEAGLKAASLIGEGLYGVDLKEVDGRVLVMEVNDNPNLDAGYEDGILKDGLYDEVIRWFRVRLDRRGREGSAS